MAIWEQIKDLNDQELVKGCAGGDEEALRVLYFRYNGLILNYLCKIIPNRAGAEDLTQETFFRVWQKASLYDEEKGSFKTWLFRIATRLALNRLKKSRRRENLAPQVPLPGREVADRSCSPVESVHVAERRNMVRHALSKMNDKDRAVLVLRHLQGMGEQEVAKVLGIPKGTVKSRTYYAVRRLKGALEGMGL